MELSMTYLVSLSSHIPQYYPFSRCHSSENPPEEQELVSYPWDNYHLREQKKQENNQPVIDFF